MLKNQGIVTTDPTYVEKVSRFFSTSFDQSTQVMINIITKTKKTKMELPVKVETEVNLS